MSEDLGRSTSGRLLLILHTSGLNAQQGVAQGLGGGRGSLGFPLVSVRGKRIQVPVAGVQEWDQGIAVYA
jgi:hypothetical protein